MTTLKHRRFAGSLIAIAVVLPLAACGDDGTEAVGDTFLPNRSEEHLIDGVQPADETRVQRDLTPTASTGGEIPGYSPVDKNEGVPIEGVPEGESVGATPPPRRVPAEEADAADASGNAVDPVQPIEPADPVAPIRPVE